MTVACKMTNCPLYDNGLCCAESILIANDGRCFNLIRGFAPDDVPKIREESKMNIEEIEVVEVTPNDNASEEETKDDNNGCVEGTRNSDEVPEAS